MILAGLLRSIPMSCKLMLSKFILLQLIDYQQSDVREVILIMSEIKKRQKSICLVIAAQWATGTQQKENIESYKRLAIAANVIPDKELIFTSDFESPKFDVGIHKQFLRELMLCTNIFIFPTREESFGLVFPEACLSSAVMPMANKSLRDDG